MVTVYEIKLLILIACHWRQLNRHETNAIFSYANRIVLSGLGKEDQNISESFQSQGLFWISVKEVTEFSIHSLKRRYAKS
ncbi:hypothetical protein M514_08345 [Trichuris suis]|uniref:Uncharacterized protein n=1 Tax=Trichuris suis TaxID=68888 RepID=A0A085N1Q0_9BILA|nr:hypothetical protein M513_08345 [Trichuris suis]KFD63396.1 hypothetical protein M514_08345 [Trichuris suis]